jgi:hypothetical protein
MSKINQCVKGIYDRVTPFFSRNHKKFNNVLKIKFLG